jgi:hypothetical protein
VVSQPTTDTAGVFPIRLSKWAKGSPDMTKERVAAAAKLLVDTGWIAVDHDTEEGLLRNYIRDDWAGDLIFKGALARALLVQSMPLRAVLLSEIRELKCDRPIFKDDQLSLIADLEQSVPPDFDLESVVGFLPPSPSPSPKPSPQAFERRPNAVETPSERRWETSGQQRDGDESEYAPAKREGLERLTERNVRDGYDR